MLHKRTDPKKYTDLILVMPDTLVLSNWNRLMSQRYVNEQELYIEDFQGVNFIYPLLVYMYVLKCPL